MRGGHALPLAPLCGGVPPDRGVAVPRAGCRGRSPGRLIEGETCRQAQAASWCGRPGASAPSPSTPCTGARISSSSGVWVHSQDKVGRDAGELAGGEPIGVVATNDADALIGLRPDCVVYAASGPERDAGAVPDYIRLLESGINVVSTTSTSLIYPPSVLLAGLAQATRGGRRSPATHRSTDRGSSPGSARTNWRSCLRHSRRRSGASRPRRSRSTTTIRSPTS